MEDNYPKAYKEVIEILKYVPQESVNKIPKSMIDTFKAKMNKNYDFKVDINKNFEEQELLEETNAILANIFRDYWATPYQKEKIEEKERYDRNKMEEEKRAIYNTVDLFKNRNIVNNKNEIKENINANLPMEIKKEKFYEKLIKFIKKILKIGVINNDT